MGLKIFKSAMKLKQKTFALGYLCFPLVWLLQNPPAVLSAVTLLLWTEAIALKKSEEL